MTKHHAIGIIPAVSGDLPEAGAPDDRFILVEKAQLLEVVASVLMEEFPPSYGLGEPSVPKYRADSLAVEVLTGLEARVLPRRP